MADTDAVIAQGLQDVEDDLSWASVWEQDIEKHSSSTPQEEVLNYFYKISEKAQQKLPADINWKPALFAPYQDPRRTAANTTLKEEKSIYFIPWDTFQWYRGQPVRSWPAEEWTTGRHSKLGNRNLKGLLNSNGVSRSINIAERVAGDPKGEEAAGKADFSEGFDCWQKIDRYSWTEFDGANNETQTQKQGIAFKLKAEEPKLPKTNAQYVKLASTGINKAEADATIVTLKNEAPPEVPRLVRSGIYIGRSCFNLLMKEGEEGYPWKKYGNAIPVREENGRGNYIFLPPEMQNPERWIDYYEHGISIPTGKPIRSRNVEGLNLLLVRLYGSNIELDQLKNIYNSVRDKAVIPIKQTAVILNQTDPELANMLKTYNHHLGTSPFGDYKTYIRLEDYLSYLKNYPGYSLPVDRAKIDAAFKTFEIKGVAAQRNERYAKLLQKNAEDARKALLPGEAENAVMLTYVSAITVARAGVRGARERVPGQIPQVGGSASTVAKELGWQNAGERLKAAQDKVNQRDIKWDSPGVYPAEWLHRSAFSWGNNLGQDSNELSQVSSNLIFGSSETNSLMTRYEKSWQRYFSKNGTIWRAKKAADPSTIAKLEPLRGTLKTINTSIALPVVQLNTKGGGIVYTKFEKKKGGIWVHEETVNSKGISEQGSETKVVNPNDRDYWRWASENVNTSYSLDYRLSLDGISLLRKPLGDLKAVFNPFQRGFFTRLEADIDYEILNTWADEAISKPTPSVASSTNLAVPQRTLVGGATGSPAGLLVSAATAEMMANASKPPFTPGSPVVASPSAPKDLPQAKVWSDAINNQPVIVGNAEVKKVGILTQNDHGQAVKIQLADGAARDARASGQMSAIVVGAPVSGASAPGASAQTLAHINADVKETTIKAPAEIVSTGADAAVPEGFTLTGEVKLFGKFDEQLYSYYNGSVHQIVVVKPGTIKISDYMPRLAGSDFESLQLENIQLVYNEVDTLTNNAGTWLQADLLLSGVLQPVSDALHSLFQQQHPMLRIQALLSPYNDWSKPIEPRSFTLRAALPGMNVELGDLITVTELAISISISRYSEAFPPFGEKVELGLTFFGSLQLDTPKDVAPLVMEFSLGEDQGFASMSLVCTDGSLNFFGIPGLHLSDVFMGTSFNVKAPSATTSLIASASLTLRNTTLSLNGYYSKSDWALHCELEDMTFEDVRNLYEDLFDSPLYTSDHDIVVQDLVFIADQSGITITGQATVEGHTSADASIRISSNGLEITGEIDDVYITKDVSLKKAALNIFIGKQVDTTLSGPGTSFRFTITGEVTVAGNDITAALYLDKTPDKKLMWTLYGQFDGAFSISKIAHELKGSFLDLSLSKACVIASNMSQRSLSSAPIPVEFPVVDGIQIAAAIGTMPILDKAMHNHGTPTVGLTLQATYAEETSAFELRINLAVAQKVAMKSSTVTSGDVSLLIIPGTSPSLTIAADFFIKTAGQDQPLQFSGGLTCNVDEAKLFLELTTEYWTNPFGLSPLVKLGPHCAVQGGIVYESPIYPSEIGLSGGLVVGSVAGKAALSISDAPNDELIMMEVDDLGVRDLVEFASLIFQRDIPKPEDFLRFKLVRLYLSSGTTIGTTFYPPGASFECDAVVFGKDASIYVGVDKRQGTVAIKGSLDPIDIGPLSISGVKPGTKANLDLELGATSQHIHIDGDIRILTLESLIYVEADLLPTPNFNISTKLAFSTHLDFELQASMRNGSFQSLQGLKNLDFDVHVLFRQDILDFIILSVNTQVAVAKHAADDGIDTAESNIKAAQAKFDASVKQARENVGQAEQAYNAKLNKAAGDLAAERTKTNIEIDRLVKAVQGAQAEWQRVVGQAQTKLKAALEEQTRQVNTAKQRVSDAKQKGDADVDSHLRDLNNAKDNMQKSFGSAIDKLNDAQRNVDNAQNAVNDARRARDEAKRDLDHAQWYRKLDKSAALAAQETRLGTTEAGLKTAEGVLDAAKGVVNGPGYQSAKAAVATYQRAVEAAKTTADATLNAANSSLTETVRAQQALVDGANAALSAAQNTGSEVLNLASSKRALAAYREASQATLSALQGAVNAVGQSAEKLAFDTAGTALKIAQANTKDLNLATGALEVVRTSAASVLDIGAWAAEHTTNILNIKTAEAWGDLRGLCQNGTELKFHIVGTFAEHDVDFSVDFMPGKGEDVAKRVFEKLVNDVKSGLLKITRGVGA